MSDSSLDSRKIRGEDSLHSLADLDSPTKL